ncbi:MAG: penicillin-binding transpeptidase domain-containing protein [Armatimonadota bacterium]|nr:penicillin-binding transpeptidase domain-containing protein [Armatimonadota bacterium]MDW8156900.1 penicillin-binding transpeptidase domain-containing protein [Armatimonadota bacterium]
MSRRVVHLARTYLTLLALLAVWAGYWQVVRDPDLARHPANPRLVLAEERIHRGRILDRHLGVLAETVRRGSRTVRTYPEGEVFAHPVGYRSLLLGKAGLEAGVDAHLLGVGQLGPWQGLRVRGDRPRRGFDVVTTLDREVQRAAWSALGARAGAVVVMEVGGAILASASRPSYNPNRLEETWAELRWSTGSPLLDRATNGLYPPGRPFGVVVLSAALSRGLITLDSPLDCPGSQRGRLAREILAGACDHALASLGRLLGGRVLWETARAFGFGKAPTSELPVADGELPEPEADPAQLDRVSSGRGGVLASPLQMAAAAATVGRGGERVQPYFVLALRDEAGAVAKRPAPPAARILAPEVAAAVQEALRASGTPQVAAVADTVRAGGLPVGWFVGLAPARRPKVVVAVVVEGEGEEVAAVMAQKVLPVALRVIP